MNPVYKIVLVGEALVLLDEEDWPRVSKFKWHILKGRSTSYVMSHRGLYMHRLILGLTSGDKRVVDHINKNGLDNRRENIRAVTQSENLRNGRTFKEAKRVQRTGRVFRVRGRVNGKQMVLATFPTKEEAIYFAWRYNERTNI